MRAMQPVMGCADEARLRAAGAAGGQDGPDPAPIVLYAQSRRKAGSISATSTAMLISNRADADPVVSWEALESA